MSALGGNTFASGGGGVTYEQRVGGYALGHLLASKAFLVPGPLVSVSFQQAQRGATFDDLQLESETGSSSARATTTVDSQIRHRIQLVRSNADFRELLSKAAAALRADPEGFADRAHHLALIVSPATRGTMPFSELLIRARRATVYDDFAESLRPGRGAHQQVRTKLRQL
jgi:hypothetical protein